MAIPQAHLNNTARGKPLRLVCFENNGELTVIADNNVVVVRTNNLVIQQHQKIAGLVAASTGADRSQRIRSR